MPAALRSKIAVQNPVATRTHLRIIASALFLSCVAWGIATAQQDAAPPSADELAKTTARGRQLAEYDVAAWHATDAVRALHPKDGEIRRYIARKTDSGWTVVFGKLSEANDAFLVAYEAKQGKSPEEFSVIRNDPPAEDRSFFLSSALAIDSALKNSTLQKRPYNTTVLPDPSGHIFIYIVPAQTNSQIYLYGGDVRFEFSGDGRNIIEKRQLHQSILEFRSDPNQKVVSGFHTHFLDDVPGDTDVFYVLSRKPPIPEMVGTRSYLYSVNVDGSIRIVQKVNARK